MALDAGTIAEVVRQRLGEGDASRHARVIWAIPDALNRLSVKIANNPKKRPLLLTKRADTSADLDDGALDIGNFLGNPSLPKIMVEFLPQGTIWYTGADIVDAYPQVARYPIQYAGAHFSDINAHQDHPFAADYLYYWLDGTNLRVLDYEIGTRVTGPIEFSVPFCPTLADFQTGLLELYDDLIDEVVEICASPVAMPADEQ